MKITFIKTAKRIKPKHSNNLENKDERIKKEVRRETNNKESVNKEKIKEAFKTIFKKNQLVLLTLALMLVTAGYMNYNNNANEVEISLAEIGDAKLVSTNVLENEVAEDNELNTENKTVESNNIDENKEQVENTLNQELNKTVDNTMQENINANTNAENTNNQKDYFAQTRLEREKMYSQMIETYQKILENESIPADQKSIASNEIKNINDKKNAISIIENLIKTKGFQDVVLLINDNNINVVVKQKDNLNTEQVAQITNIVSRELNAEIKDIHLSTQN